MNISKIATTISAKLTDIKTKNVAIPTKNAMFFSLNGLNALSSYNSGNIKKLIKYGNIQILPISSEKEFDLLMNSLKRNKNNMFIFEHCFASCNSEDKHIKALQGYCGEHDISKYINYYLATGKFFPKMYVKNLITGKIYTLREKDLKKYIRILEYSLKKADETIPRYEGNVFRSGHFNKNGGQFWSTSKNAKGAVAHAGIEITHTNKAITFSVIKTAKGTDIQEINRGTCFEKEAEVLLNPNSKFIDITDEIPEEEYTEYYNQILHNILEIIKINLGTEDIKKAKEALGSLKVYRQT